MVPVGWFAFALIIIISFAGGGCTTAWIQAARLAPTGLSPDDAIAIVLTPSLVDGDLPGLENQVTACIRDALDQKYPELRIVPSDEFRKLAFSDLSPEKSLASYFSWGGLVNNPAFYGRIAPLGLRYVIVVDSEQRTRLTDFEWTGPVGGPSLYWSWERSILIQAVVVDARHRHVAGSVQAYASGKSGAGLMLITFPMPLPIPYGTTSFPLSVACQGLGEGLAKFLAAGSPAEEQAPEQKKN